jgi:hypothetical protein
VITVAAATAQLARQSAAVLPVSTQLTAGAVAMVTVVDTTVGAAPPDVIVRSAGAMAVKVVVAVAASAAETQTEKSTTTDPAVIELMTTSSASTPIAATIAVVNSVSKVARAAEPTAIAVISTA